MCEALIHLVESTLNVSAYAARFPLTKRTDAAAADADAAEAQLTYFATGTFRALRDERTDVVLRDLSGSSQREGLRRPSWSAWRQAAGDRPARMGSQRPKTVQPILLYYRQAYPHHASSAFLGSRE
jgi:hypothetical protein